MTRTAELCAGYGGLGMAVAEVLGGEVAWTAEIDEDASKILAHRFPSPPNHGDITAADWALIEPPDVFCAGFPCQPVSLAGKRLGEADERWIWPAVAGAVRDLRPGLVFLENVSALVVRGLAGVAADLAQIGYVGSWCCVRASDVGACHRRERVFILARPAEDADRTVGGERRLAASGQAARRRSRPDLGRPSGAPAALRGNALADPYGDGLAWSTQRDGQPELRQASHEQRRVDPLRRVLDWGIYTLAIRRWERALGRPAPRPTEPGRTGERLSPRFVEWMMGLPEGWVTDVPGLSRNAQLKALGNGVVPQQAAMALRMLLDRADIAPLAATEEVA